MHGDHVPGNLLTQAHARVVALGDDVETPQLRGGAGEAASAGDGQERQQIVEVRAPLS